MSKKSCRETIGVKVRSEILSPGKNFLFWHIWCDMLRWNSVQRAISALWLQRATPALRIRNFKPVVRKISPQHFLPILGAPQPKIMNPFFWLSCDQMVILTGVRPKPGFGHFEVRPWVKFLKFWPGETSDLYANGPESSPPGFFTPFWDPMAGNYESGFLTGLRQMMLFTNVRPKSMFGLFDHCATRKGLKNPRVLVG